MARTGLQTSSVPTQARESIRVAVIGQQLVVRMEAARETFSAITLKGSQRDLQRFNNDTSQVAADVLLIEQPTLPADAANEVCDGIRRIKASATTGT